jgi:hemoglobin
VRDITDRDDIVLLVNSFYSKVKGDELLAAKFQHLDWGKHLPIMFNFWSSVLLGDQSYQNNPFQKHMALSIDASHFDQWLKLFSQTVDENFAGMKAEETKSQAQSIVGVWQFKLGLLK